MMLDLETNETIVSIDCNNVNDGIKGIREYLNRLSVGNSCDENPIYMSFENGLVTKIAIAIHMDTHYVLEFIN